MPTYGVAQGHMKTGVPHQGHAWIDNIKHADDKITDESNTWNRNKLSAE